MNALVRTRTACRLCGSSNIACSVPLAAVPIVSPNVGTEETEGERITRVTAPLDTYLCGDCGLIQLVHVVDPALIYRNYLYRTSVSRGLAEHFRDLARAVVDRATLRADDLVVEFGSNDGTLLRCFAESGQRVQGVDPAVGIAREATRAGVPTRADFFGREVAADLRAEMGPARAVIANNAMANIDDLADILDGVRSLLAADGVFVFETQYALDVFEKTLLDVIYHEHISCFSVRPLVEAFGSHGLQVFDVERIPTKGGSIRVWVQAERGPQPTSPRVDELIALEKATGLYDPGYHARFSDKVAAIKAEIHRLIGEARASGGPVGAYGTSVGCAALIHQFELEDALECLFDDSPFKARLEGPGYDLPVYTADGVGELQPALIIILAWRYAEPIVAKHRRYLEAGGRFVVPLPDLRLVG